MRTYYLEPRYDGRKSFYKKAWVRENDDNTIDLISYATKVATINTNIIPATCRINGTYSPTTLRHIKEFLKQYNMPCGSKNDIINMYMS